MIHAPAVATQALGEKPESRVVAGIDLTQPPWHIEDHQPFPHSIIREDGWADAQLPPTEGLFTLRTHAAAPASSVTVPPPRRAPEPCAARSAKLALEALVNTLLNLGIAAFYHANS